MSKNINTSFLIAILGIALLPLYQNCSNTFDFEKQSDYALTQGEAEIVDFNISPNSWENRPKIDITVIVDNSNSMQPIQEKVAAALERTLSPLSNFSGKIEVFTTTQYENFDGGDKISRDVVFYKNGVESLNAPDARPYTEKHELPASFTSANSVDYAALEYRPATLDAVTQQFGSSIRGIGTGGSSTEEGLCSLLRLVEKKSQSESGSFNAILMVSNENDQTDFSKCIKEIEHKVQAEINYNDNNCTNEDHIASHASCKYVSGARWTQSTDYKKYTLNYNSNSTEWVKASNPRDKARLYVKYYRRTVKIAYKEKQYSRNLSIEGFISNDGIEAKRETFNHTNNGLNSCTELSEMACSAEEISSLNSMGFKIDGRNVTIDSSTCRKTCTAQADKSLSQTISSNDVGKCAGLDYNSTYGSKCDGKTDCQWSCNESTAAKNYYGGYTDEASCEAVSGLDNNSVNTDLFSRLKISSGYYNSSSDLLVKITDRDAVHTDSRVYCLSGRTYYSQAVNNGVTDTNYKYRAYSSSTPSFLSSHTEIDCNDPDMPTKLQGYSSASDDVKCWSKTSGSIKSISAVSTDFWDDNSACSLAEAPTSLKDQLPGYAESVTCFASKETKNTSADCTLEASRVNVCNTDDRVSTLLNSCPDIATKIDLNKEHSFSCGTNITGTYQLPQNDIVNFQETVKFVPTGTVSEIAQNMKDKLRNFQYANFVIPSDLEIPASASNHSCFGSNPGAFSHGTKFMDLADELNNGQDSPIAANYSICDSDYSPAVQSVVDRAIAQAEYSYRFELAYNETVYKVFIVDNAGVSTFVAPNKYTVGNGLIKFLDRTLINENTSSIKIQIWRDLIMEDPGSSPKVASVE